MPDCSIALLLPAAGAMDEIRTAAISGRGRALAQGRERGHHGGMTTPGLDQDRLRALGRWFQFTPQECLLVAGVLLILLFGLWARWHHLRTEPPADYPVLEELDAGY